MKLILVDPNPDLCEAWLKAFDTSESVEVMNCRFEELDKFDCMVSAANSFGMMDGGVDRAICEYFGWELMKQVQKRILDEYRGMQPVGTSMIVETDDSAHPWLAHTPTMRVPNPIEADDVYTAMWAMLLAVDRHNQSWRVGDIEGYQTIKTLACPGLGTNTGKVAPKTAARMMALAYKHFMKPPSRLDWSFVGLREWAIHNARENTRL